MSGYSVARVHKGDQAGLAPHRIYIYIYTYLERSTGAHRDHPRSRDVLGGHLRRVVRRRLPRAHPAVRGRGRGRGRGRHVLLHIPTRALDMPCHAMHAARVPATAAPSKHTGGAWASSSRSTAGEMEMGSPVLVPPTAARLWPTVCRTSTIRTACAPRSADRQPTHAAPHATHRDAYLRPCCRCGRSRGRHRSSPTSVRPDATTSQISPIRQTWTPAQATLQVR
jgi:hypothetical protein